MTWSIPKEKESRLKLIFHDSASLINEQHWNKINNNQNVYLSIPYLKSLENSLRDDIRFRYVLFYDENNEPVAIAMAQMVRFTDAQSKYNDDLCKVTSHLKTKILKHLDIKVMVCGNVFACGENGFMYDNSRLNDKEAYENLNLALYRLRKAEKINGQTSIVLLKEFWPESFNKSDHLKENDYREFMIDVNMVLKIHESWNTLDDYLQSMVAKFRTKAKGVFKKSKSIDRRELCAEEINQFSSEIQELYLNVLEKADFKIGQLNSSSFVELKNQLKDNFIFSGYFMGEKLVGFSTGFLYDNYLDANYVGLDYELNYQHAIYQRMLYDFVDLSIKHRVKELRLGRTAEEIKSCLGAEPTNMKLYIKFRNTVSHKLLKPIIESISPSEFELRKPFKAAFN